MDTDALIVVISRCLMPKLAKNVDESETHSEFEVRKNNIAHNFTTIMELTINLELSEYSRMLSRALAYLIIIYKEMQSHSQWNTKKINVCSQQLNSVFLLAHNLTLENILHKEQASQVNYQDVFDDCLEYLSQKCTSEDFKKYPSLIEVYCLLMKELKKYNVTVKPLKALPLSFILIDDYSVIYKVKGLKCCKSILRRSSPENFANGNYYEVLYGCLRKVLSVQDVKVTKLLHKCFMELLRLLPSDVKTTKTDDLYANVLDRLHTESNLYRKAVLFKLTTDLIKINGVTCVKRKKIFFVVTCENIDVCTNDAVAEILLQHVLDALEEWIKHCWCVWQLSKDHKLLLVLFKILYVCKKDDEAQRLMKVIATLATLCTEEEKNKIMSNLDRSSEIKSQVFQQRIDLVKKYIKNA